MKKYKNAVIIGRFQIPHDGHLALFKKALSCADNVVIAIGSSEQPRSPKNPFTSKERSEMLEDFLRFHNVWESHRISFVGVPDIWGGDQTWASMLEAKVSPLLKDHVLIKDTVLVGHTKDNSSYYLEMFPQWHYVEVGSQGVTSSTHLREKFFYGELSGINYLVKTYLKNWKKNNAKAYRQLQVDHTANKIYPDYVQRFPRNEQTADAVVVQNGHILLIQRANGNWALPGGFVNTNESVLEAAFRELNEETRIDIPRKALEYALKNDQGYRFDRPDRDERGRIITTAFLFVLPTNHGKLTKVKAGDDAKEAVWFSLSEVKNMRRVIYADHSEIINKMVSGL